MNCSASSSSIERAFSVAKDVFTSKKNRMKSSTLQQMMRVRTGGQLLKTVRNEYPVITQKIPKTDQLQTGDSGHNPFENYSILDILESDTD